MKKLFYQGGGIGVWFVLMSLISFVPAEKIFAQQVNPGDREVSVPAKYQDCAALFREGVKHTFNKEYEEAVNDMNKVIAVHPDYADAHYNLGIAYCYLGDKDKGKYHFEQAIELYEKRGFHANAQHVQKVMDSMLRNR